MRPDEELAELRDICPGATPATDGPLSLVLLPKLIVTSNNGPIEVEYGVLCLTEHEGYKTRLFLSQPFPTKGQNWKVYTILGRPWHCCSWQGVPQSQSLLQILLQHLQVLR
jgi:hypothetical protein